MKFLLLTFMLATSLFGMSQTAVIAAKSHSGSINDIASTEDNFGEIAPPPKIDTVIYVDKHRIIEIGTRWGSMRFRDTIVDHYYFQQNGMSKEILQQYYRQGVKFIGFDFETSNESENDRSFFFSGRQNRNGLNWLILIIALGFAGYIITPLIKRHAK
jgi:hypothetical protein